MVINYSTTRQRIAFWLVFRLRPDTMSLIDAMQYKRPL
jgi:hypothetical protein